MADTNRSNNAQSNDIAEDDPFAELTRIMGHDPRAGAGKSPAEEGGDQDLEIDLESELMGGLSDFDDGRSAPLQEAASEPEPESATRDAANENADDALAELDLQMELDTAFEAFEEGAAPETSGIRAVPAFGPEQDAPEASKYAETRDAEEDFDDGEGPTFLRQSEPEAEDRSADEAESVGTAEDTAPSAAAEEPSDFDLDLIVPPVGEDEGAEAVSQQADERANNPEDPTPDGAEDPETLFSISDADVAVEQGSAPELAPFESATDGAPGEGGDNHETTSETSEAALSAGSWPESDPDAASGPVTVRRDTSFGIIPVRPGDEAASDPAGSGDVAFDETEVSTADEPDDGDDGASSTEENEHFPPLYAEQQPAMAPEEDARAGESDPEAEAAEAFDYSRAASDRHDFLAETLEAETFSAEPVPVDDGRDADAFSTASIAVTDEVAERDMAGEPAADFPQSEASAVADEAEGVRRDGADEPDVVPAFAAGEPAHGDAQATEADEDGFEFSDSDLQDLELQESDLREPEQDSTDAGFTGDSEAPVPPDSAAWQQDPATADAEEATAEWREGAAEPDEVSAHPDDNEPVWREETAIRGAQDTADNREDDPFGILAGGALSEKHEPGVSEPTITAPSGSFIGFEAEERGDEYEESESAFGTAPTSSERLETESVETAPAGYETSRTEAPEVETIDISEGPIALADDLDIPEMKQEEETPAALEFDDFEAELAGAFGTLSSKPSGGEEKRSDTSESDERQASNAAAASAAPAAYSYDGGADETSMSADGALTESSLMAGAGYNHSDSDHGRAAESGIDNEYAGAARQESTDFQFDPDAGEEMAAYPDEAEARRGSGRRGILVAGIVAAVAIIGGIGAFALSSGDEGASSPALVKAGDDPVKVKPENPGGAKVPNQDSEVYRRVAGKDAEAPAQKKLVSTTEEPMDVSQTVGAEPRVVTPTPISQEVDEVSGDSGKSEDRLAPSVDEDNSQMSDEVATVQPRRVKTVVVKPDGTIVPAEEASATETMPASVSSNPVSTGNTTDAASAADDAQSAGTSPGLDESADAADGAMKPSADGDAVTPDEPSAATETPPTPSASPNATPQESAEPQVASAGPANDGEAAVTGADAPVTDSATSEWSVQISSQPSVKAAQQSYQNMARRYDDVLSGKGVNIVRADIDGKGTYYRVRIPSTSKDDAIALCSELKSAGGSCFVSK